MQLVRTQTKGSIRVSATPANLTEEFHFLNRTKANRNAFFEFQLTIFKEGVCGDIRVPPRQRPCTPYTHVHIDQTEKFTLLQGRLAYQQGDTIHSCDVHTCPSPLIIPPFVAHTYWMADNQEDLIFIVRVEPAYETHGFRAEAIENIVGARRDGHMTLWQALVFIDNIESFPTSLPLFLTRLLFRIGSLVGRLFGYRTEYDAYTTRDLP